MELFAKERKTKKTEIWKLKDEKNELVQRWKHDSAKHQEFYEFMNHKVMDCEKAIHKYKDRSEHLGL
jgi:hypothetical protein